VFLQTWYELPELNTAGDLDEGDWQRIIDLRTWVSRELEEVRNRGEIGSALETRVELWLADADFDLLTKLQNELRFLLITSGAVVYPLAEKPAEVTVEQTGRAIRIVPLTDPKCGRCWHRQADIGESEEHPQLCGRCVTNLGVGEQRQIA